MPQFVMPISPIQEWPAALPIEAVRYALSKVLNDYFTYTCNAVYWHVQTYHGQPAVLGETEEEQTARVIASIRAASLAEEAYQKLLLANGISTVGSGFSMSNLPEELVNPAFELNESTQFDQHHRAGFLLALIAEYERLHNAQEEG